MSDIPTLSHAAKHGAFDAFEAAMRSGPFEQSVAFPFLLAEKIEAMPEEVRREFDGLKTETAFVIYEGRSEVRFLTQEGDLVFMMRGPLISDRVDEW